MSIVKQLHNSVKFPTSIIVKGANILGVEIARSLLEQGGFVIIIDSESNASRKLLEPLAQYKNLTVLNFNSVPNLAEDLRRLDYIFYFEHKSTGLAERISTQKFLQNSNFLDSMLDLTAKFDAKFLLTTSIKAHQHNLSNAQFDYNFGVNSKAKHSEYMELEIQRYAESLVNEYEEKVGINARVLRVGEIIGRGCEFEQSSSLYKLIKEGIEGKNMYIPGDGLEANYYIHYLDAAYGVLKAQFSASSKGRIFTLANPEEITVLSIAYKLLELLPTAREIKFDGDDDKYPPLILYKAAENLSGIGWKPRIGFDRALVQTIEYIQELLIIENALRKDHELSIAESKNLTNKIKDFFFVAENEPEEADAISKLIAERKKLEMTRTGSMVQANANRRGGRKRKERLSPLQKIDLFLHDSLFGFSKRISFLKNVTLTDFIVTIFLFAGFVVIYFVLVSPLFSLSRNIFSTKLYFDRATLAVENFDFEKAKEENMKLSSNLQSAQQRVEDIQYLFTFTGKTQLYSDTQRFLENSIEYSQAYDDLLQAYTPLQIYFEKVNPNLTYRYGENKLLSAKDEATYKSELDDIAAQKGRVTDSIARIIKAKQETDIFAEKLPSRFKNILKDKRTDFDKQFAQYDYLGDYYSFWPILLGNETPVNYLLVVQDNTLYSSAGGNIIGYISFTLDKGALKAIDTEVISLPELDKSVVSDTAISSINLVTSKEVNRNNIVFDDLAYISDESLYYQTIKNNYENIRKTKIDLVLSINTSGLSRMLQNGSEVTFQQVNFNKDNLLNNLNLLGDEKDLSQRHSLIMNLFAKAISDRTTNLEDSIFDWATFLSESSSNKDMAIYSVNPDFENFIQTVNGITINPSEEIGFGMNSAFTAEGKIDKYPIVTISGDVAVNADYTTTKDLLLELNSSDNLQNAYLCISGGGKNLVSTDVSPELVSTTFSTSKTCNIYLHENDLDYGLKYDTLAFANPEAKQTVYVLRLIKTPGIESNYDLEFSFDVALAVMAEDTGFVKQDNKYIYSGILTEDKIFKFEISK